MSSVGRSRWRLDGQLALVTGGSAGIGRAIASELLGFGARVLIAARDGDALEAAREELLELHPDGEVRALVASHHERIAAAHDDVANLAVRKIRADLHQNVRQARQVYGAVRTPLSHRTC